MAGVRDFSLLKNVQTKLGSHLTSCAGEVAGV
jgi:hypothetical protein